ncbi:MAG: lipid-A-disaccharide synthase [Deltaproteobacteria bacterium]|nr:lipid-A-disaccharide synthase [Deltaproteobacteria bacterium]MBW1819339.1 lipid-A-disaccharide synthase [Deltaproteobacteria bacterium]
MSPARQICDSEPQVLISTGEVSGDLIGAGLAKALLACDPSARLWGVGGFRMEEAGVRIIDNTNLLGSVGITEPLSTVPGVMRTFRRIRDHVRNRRPDVAVLIGHEFFHMILARWLRAGGIPTVAYFPPQVWIWRRLAGPIARSYDLILTSFPEEHRVYRMAGGNVLFVGHYLRDLLKPVSPEGRAAARHELGLDGPGPVIGLLPGSRMQEVDRLLPLFLDAAEDLRRGEPQARFVVPAAESSFAKAAERLIENRAWKDRVTVTRGSHQAMTASDLIISCSGTATLEAMLIGVPMVIVYQVSGITWLVVEFLDRSGLIHSKTAGLPNLIAGKRLVPEIIQYEAVPSQIGREALSILHDPGRQQRIKADFETVAAMMGEPGAAERAARAVMSKKSGPIGPGVLAAPIEGRAMIKSYK